MFFLWLTVVCEIDILVKFLHFVFISAAISMGCKWVRKSKNPLRAQSKYGLMGSSCKKQEIFFRRSPEHFLHKNAIWDRTPPHLHINCSLHVCGRIQGSQIFKQNSIISIRSKVMAFFCDFVVPVVATLSPLSPHCPRF